MNTDQIAAEAAEIIGKHTDIENRFFVIKSAIEKAIQNDRISCPPLSRAARASEQPEEDFVAANHHPSCKITDQDLMWVCAQCGLKVSE